MKLRPSSVSGASGEASKQPAVAFRNTPRLGAPPDRNSDRVFARAAHNVEMP
jgi:hypothetical protein